MPENTEAVRVYKYCAREKMWEEGFYKVHRDFFHNNNRTFFLYSTGKRVKGHHQLLPGYAICGESQGDFRIYQRMGKRKV